MGTREQKEKERGSGPRPVTALAARTWWRLPLGRRAKRAIKTAFFTVFGVLFKSTRPYKNWAEIRRLERAARSGEQSAFPDYYDRELLTRSPRTAAPTPPPISRVVLAVHAFYPDIYGRILDKFESGFRGRADHRVEALVSTTAEQEAKIREISRGRDYPVAVQAFPNRGRDALPFLRLAAGIDDEGALIVKVHTKRANHRLTGELWREDLLEGLLGAGKIECALDYLNEHPRVGLIGPRGHVVPMSLYFGGNALALRFFAQVFGIPLGELLKMSFIAGGMFMARRGALEPLLSLAVPDSMFEAEAGQIDGTLAHAIERVYSLSARYQGLTISDTSFPKDETSLKTAQDHPFTW